MLKLSSEITNKIPYDIEHKILDDLYGLIHRENINKLLYDICKKAIQLQLEDKFFDYFLDIREYLSEYEVDNAVFVLSNCKCCSEHIINRPTYDDFKNGVVPIYSTKHSRSKTCRCSCRYLIRNICRGVNDEILDI